MQARATSPRVRSGPPRPATATRRPQARTLVTRARILEAAVESLMEAGYAGTTTTEICRRAEVSQGALFKHFSSKIELLCAAVEHLFAAMVSDYRRAFARLAPENGRADTADRIRHALELLRATFAQPRLHAAFELYLAARTEPALRRAIEPILAAHRANLHQEARRLFPAEAERTPDFEAVVDAVLDAMQGAALAAIVGTDLAGDAPLLRVLERFLASELHPSARGAE